MVVKNKINRNRIKQILRLKGEVRGAVFQTDKNYILMNYGEEGLKKLIGNAEALGIKLPYEKTSSLEWHPAGLRILSLLFIKETFNLTDEKIVNMGYIAPKSSFVVKLLMKFFINLNSLVIKIPDYWREHWSVGSLEIIKYDEAGKILILGLKKFKIDPVFCLYETGFFRKMLEFTVGSGVEVNETKCMSNGNKWHEFKITW